VVIAAVAPNTPAASAASRSVNEKGMPGDIIIAVNGRPVESLPTFAAEIDRAGIDSTAELTVVRDGKERKVKVKVIDLTGK
jgi:2-alkenal reductase